MKVNRNVTHKFPCNKTYWFTDGTQRQFDNIIYEEMATWFHEFFEDGTSIIINPDKVKFIKVEVCNE